MNPAVAAPPKIEPEPTGRRVPVWFWLVGPSLIGALWVVKSVPPSGQFFFPRCWVYQTTGLQCPTCGATRAIHALLNGNIQQAFQYNALVVLAVPLLVWLTLRGWHGWRTGRWWPNPLTHPAAIAIIAGLAVGFGIARNFGG